MHDEILYIIGITEKFGWLCSLLLVFIFIDTCSKVLSIIWKNRHKKLSQVLEKSLRSSSLTNGLFIKLCKYSITLFLVIGLNAAIHLSGADIGFEINGTSVYAILVLIFSEAISIIANVIQTLDEKEIERIQKIFGFTSKFLNQDLVNGIKTFFKTFFSENKEEDGQNDSTDEDKKGDDDDGN